VIGVLCQPRSADVGWIADETLLLGDREDRGEVRAGRMRRCVGVTIVEIERMRARPVEQRCVEHRKPLRVADDGGGARIVDARKIVQHLMRDRLLRTGDGGREIVHQSTLEGMHGTLAQVVVRGLGHVARKTAGGIGMLGGGARRCDVVHRVVSKDQAGRGR
jgi:hypothetical protein